MSSKDEQEDSKGSSPHSLYAEDSRKSRQSLRFAGLGLEIAGLMAVCSLIGWRLDQHYHHRIPYLMIIGLVAAFVGRMYLLFKETKPWR